jgi:hypothetical protein
MMQGQTPMLLYLTVLQASVYSPHHLRRRCVAQGLTVPDILLGQYHSQLPWPQRPAIPRQATLGLGQAGLGNFGRVVKLRFHRSEKSLLRCFGFEPFLFWIVHVRHLYARGSRDSLRRLIRGDK